MRPIRDLNKKTKDIITVNAAIAPNGWVKILINILDPEFNTIFIVPLAILNKTETIKIVNQVNNVCERCFLR